MSFNADAQMAARNLTYEALIPYNPQHEAIAAEVLRDAIPESIGEAYQRLVWLAQQLKGLDTPIDDCLDCWTNPAKVKMGGVEGSRFQPWPGKRGFAASDADSADPLILSMRRIAMFDVPRRLFAEAHGLWVYWLFDGVFVLSPTENVDLNWAFQRHAYRLEWGLTNKEPQALRNPSDASEYVLGHLLRNAGQAPAIFADAFAANPGEVFNIEVEGPLFEPTTAWSGSLTGRELLRHELGYTSPVVTYNCHGSTPPAEGPPSAVKQLQNQSPDKRNC